MTNKERVHAALAGKPVDRYPVTSLYNFLYQDDHFAELTGLPAWRWHEWQATTPDRHAEWFARMHAQAPFELLQPHSWAPGRAWRERQEFVERDGHGWRHDRQTDEWVQLDTPAASGHATDYHANETQTVFDQRDIADKVRVVPAEAMLADGTNDYLDAIVSRFGRDEFIISGGVIGTLYSCHGYVGLTNLFGLLLDQPDLIDELSRRILAQNVEQIRRLAKAGGDAIYIDDATATCDMISAAMYERFSLPYMQAMVREIHRLEQKAILVYFGGIADRLEQIASIGADGLLFEASMKGYVNDVTAISRAIGDRVTIFGNVDPVGVLQNASARELSVEVERQIAGGRQARGFVLSTASPITPGTPLARVRKVLELGRRLGASASAPAGRR